jgi:hypothetical protein
MGKESVQPRVVFIPGFMGSVLVDEELDLHGHEEAVKMCRENLGSILSSERLPIFLEGRDICGSDSDAAVLWGTLDMLHWILGPGEWEARLMQGNGYDNPGNIRVPAKSGSRGIQGLVRATGKLKYIGIDKIDIPYFPIDLRYPGIPATDIHFRPYDDIINELTLHQDTTQGKADVRVFPYDWRLSNTYNARRLEDQIIRWWWKDRTPLDIDPLSRITIIAHSMGGVLARYFIESEALRGSRYVRQLITVGTPHLGLPEAYTNLLGVTRPFGLNGVGRKVIDAIAFILDATGKDVSDAPTHLMTKHMQNHLLKHFSSVIELLPFYDFVCYHEARCEQKKYERYDLTYRNGIGNMFHDSNLIFDGKPATIWRILSRFRDGLIPPEKLDYWLGCHQIQYHFLSGEGLKTVVAFHSGQKQEPIYSTQGDGVVPTKSALMQGLLGDNVTNINLTNFKKDDLESYDHQELLQVKKIRDYCVNQVFQWVNTAATLNWSSASRPSSITKLRDMAYTVMPDMFVYCVIRLYFSNTDSTPVFRDAISTRINSGLPALDNDRPLNISSERYTKTTSNRYAKGIPGLAQDGNIAQIREKDSPFTWWDIVYIASSGSGKLVQAKVDGGILFLPQRCQPFVDLVTWNVGKSHETRNCSNAQHAESQFIHWLCLQDKSWIQRIEKIEISNRKSSPCCYCCDGLVRLLESGGVFVSKPIATISWQIPYESREEIPGGLGQCHYTTTRKSLNRMVKAGWHMDEALVKSIRWEGEMGSANLCDGMGKELAKKSTR